MTPLKIDSIKDKLFRLNEHIKFVDDVLKNSDSEIVKDLSLYYSLEHILQLSIQIILDLGSHIISEEFQEVPKDYTEVISLLGKHKIIGQDFADIQVRMAKFRNRLVHDYDNIDKQKVLEYARSAPGVFRTFGKSFTDFIKKES
jgi:uncharacterized protein YutE (UPF0331/DUF86 family)